jgi:predicted nucleotidyltransferase
MYEKLNITENHLQVLSLFTRGFTRDYYIREVQKILGISPRTAQLILYDLEKKAVLESATKGKIRTYRIKKTDTARQYLIFAEQYKAMTFLKKRPVIKEIVDKISPFIDGIGIIFGSYAKGLEKKGSDLDIFVAGTCNSEEIKKVSELYGVRVSVKKYPPEIFKKSIRNDALVKEVLDSHVAFLNAEQFIKSVLENG